MKAQRSNSSWLRWNASFSAVFALAALLISCDFDPNARDVPGGLVKRGHEDKVAVAGKPGVVKTSASDRANRRAFDGAPPVIPHQNFHSACTSCHNERGMEVQPFGFAPPSPHELTGGLSAMSRCQQCHVFKQTETVMVANSFVGLQQDLRKGKRLNPHAPPVMPHDIFMRENCTGCHAGPAAREEIRTSHSERVRCVQCHATKYSADVFERLLTP